MSRKSAQSTFNELLSIAEERREQAHKHFNTARTNLRNAETYGTASLADIARQAFREAGTRYAEALAECKWAVLAYAEVV